MRERLHIILYLCVMAISPPAFSANQSAAKLEGLAIIIVDAFLIPSNQSRNKSEDIRQAWAPSNLSEELELMTQILQKANQNKVPVLEIHIKNGHETNPQLLSMYNDQNWISIGKNSYSAFTNTSLNKKLRELNISKLIFMGFNQKLCVKESVRDALSLNYDVFTSFDILQGHRAESDDLVRQFYEENTYLRSGEELIDEFFL